MRREIVCLLSTFALGCWPLASSAEEVQSTVQACGIIADAKHHAGELVEFRGSYGSDGLERAAVTPDGCRNSIGVYAFADGLPQVMDPKVKPGMYPALPVQGVFKGAIIMVPPNTAQFFNDGGVRLVILDFAPSNLTNGNRAR